VIAARTNLGWCELEDIKPPCDPYMTQEAGCVCRDAAGNLVDRTGAVVPIYGAAPTPVFAWPNLDTNTIGLALGILVVFLMARK